MKSDVPRGAIVAIGVVIVLIIGFIAYRQFGGNPAEITATPQQINEVKQMRSSIMAPGVHRDVNGHFVDAQGNPVNTAPTVKGQ